MFGPKVNSATIVFVPGRMLSPIPAVLVSTPAPIVTEVGGPVGGEANATAARASEAASAIAAIAPIVRFVRVLFMIPSPSASLRMHVRVIRPAPSIR